MSIKAKPILARLITAKKITARLIQVFSKICRYFSTFNGSTSYAALTDEIVLSGDFEIEVDFFVESQPANNLPILSDSSSAFYITVGANSDDLIVQMPTSGANAFIILSGITFGQNLKLVFKRAGNNFELGFNGLSQSQSISNALSTLSIDELGARGAARFDGQLSDLKIWSGGGQYDSGELYSFAKMGGDPVGTLTQVGVDGFNYDATVEQDDRIYLNLTTVAGVKYRLEYNEITSASGSIFARDGVDGGGAVLNSSAFSGNSLEFIATSTTTTLLFDGDINVFLFNFRDLSVRSVVGTLILDLPMSEGLKDVYNEVFYRNRVANQDAWYLNLINNSEVLFQKISLSSDFVIKAKITRRNTSGGNGEMALVGKDDTTNQSFIVLKDTTHATQPNTVTIRPQGGSSDINFLNVLPSNLGVFFDFELSVVSGVCELFIDSSSVGFGSASLTTNLDIEAFGSSDQRRFFENVSAQGFEVWSGNKTTGTKLIDYSFNDNSNIIANAASPVNSNVWDGDVATATGDSEILSEDSVRIYSPSGLFSEVRVSSSGAQGKDHLVTVTTDGDITKVIAGESTTQMNGWVNVRDAYGQPTNTFQTLSNNPNSDNLILKRLTTVDVTLTDISFVKVEGYGVLQGTRNTDYEWKNETPHAIGYDVSTVNTCTTDGQQWFDAVAWNDGEPWID